MVETYKGLVDWRGRPIQKKALTEEVAGPSLAGVRSPMTGYPGDGLNPGRLASILKEADAGHPIRQLELAETVEERDPHILGILATRKRSVSQLDLSVEAASDDAQHSQHAELVRAWLKRDELMAELFDMLDAIHKGYSFTEIIWDSSEGDWWVERLEWRDPRWFDFDRASLSQPQLIAEHGERVPLPPGKFVYNTMGAKSGIPTRGGLSRVLGWVWMFKAFSNRDWAIFTQTFGQPIRVGKYGQGATADDKKALFRAIANVAGDMAAMIPASMEIEFVEAANVGASSDLYEKRVTHLNLEASKAVLGQTTTTDAISGGHAVSQEHRLVQEDIERADARQLAAVINRDLVRVWIDLQFGPQEAYPRVRIGRPEVKDVKLIAETVRAFRLPVKKAEAYELAGVSVPGPADEVIQTASTRLEEGPPLTEEETRVPRRERLTEAVQAPLRQPDPDEAAAAAAAREVDELVAETGIRAADALGALIEMIGHVIAEAQSLEDVRTRLLALNPEMSTRSLALALRQAQVVARLSGRRELLDELDA